MESRAFHLTLEGNQFEQRRQGLLPLQLGNALSSHEGQVLLLFFLREILVAGLIDPPIKDLDKELCLFWAFIFLPALVQHDLFFVLSTLKQVLGYLVASLEVALQLFQNFLL